MVIEYLNNISEMLEVSVEIESDIEGPIFSNIRDEEEHKYPLLISSLGQTAENGVRLNIYHKRGDQKAMAEAERLITAKLNDFTEVMNLTHELLANYDKLNIYRNLAEQVLQTGDRKESYRLLLSALESLAKAGRCGLFSVTAKNGVMRLAALREMGKDAPDAEHSYAIRGTLFEGVARAQRSSSLFQTVAETIPALDNGHNLVIKGAFMAVPLLFRKPDSEPQLAGFIFATDPREGSFTSIDQHAISTIASLASIAMKHFDQMETTFRATREMDTMLSELMSTFTDLQRQSALIEQVNRISVRINSTLDMQMIFNSIADYSRSLLEAGQSVVAVMGGTKRVSFAGMAGFPRANMPGATIIKPESILALTFGGGKALIENSFNPKAVELGFDPPFEVRNLITYPIESKHGIVAVIAVFNKMDAAPFTEQDTELLKSLAYQATTAIENARLLNDLKQTQLTMMVKLSELAEKRDPETGEHLLRMQKYCRIIAQELAKTEKYAGIIDERFINELYAAAPLHDIGKVAIADCVLLKRGKLTNEEFDIMKTHSLVGEMILKGPDYLKMASEIAGFHHEKWDGSGYPHRLAGEQIPLSARIVAVADVYDALTSRRVYKEDMSHEYSMEIIEQGSGKHFAPDCVEALKAGINDIITIKNLIR